MKQNEDDGEWCNELNKSKETNDKNEASRTETYVLDGLHTKTGKRRETETCLFVL